MRDCASKYIHSGSEGGFVVSEQFGHTEYNRFSHFIETIQNFGTGHSFLLLWLTTRKATSIPTQLPSQPVMQGPQVCSNGIIQ